MEQVDDSNFSLTFSPIQCKTGVELNHQEDNMLYHIPWNHSQSVWMGVFLGCIFFACGANAFLFFTLVRYRQLLWQPQYIFLQNISVCGIVFTTLIAGLVLSSVLHKQTQIFDNWCLIQFCLLRFFFLNTQMILALMAVERYIFICFSIHYLRLISAQNIWICIGLVWLLSGTVSVHGWVVLSQIQRGIQEPTSGLLCSALTIKEHIEFYWEEDMQIFGPPSFILVVCILTICFCYGSMYLTARKVTVTLKCSNHRANCTVGIYFSFFLLQMTPNIIFIISTILGQKKNSSFLTVTAIAVPTLVIIPYCIIPVFLIIRNPQIKRLVFCMTKCHFTCTTETEVTEEQMMEEIMCEVGNERQVGTEYVEIPAPLPGYVLSENSW